MLKILFLLSSLLALSVDAGEVKFIHAGQKLPTDISVIASNIRQIEEAVPYDGMIFPLNTKIRLQDGTEKDFSTMFTSSGRIPISSIPRLEREQLRPWIRIAKAVPFRKLTHNFLYVNTNCIGKNWFDDKAWEKVIHNYRLLAWAAKEADLKGIVFDIEQYRADSQYLCYDPALGYSYENTAKQARKRGKQLIEAMGAEFPDMQFFTYMWQMEFNNRDIYRNFPRYREIHGYGLLPPFVNGVFDGVPPGMRIIEGNESFGYHAGSYRDIDRLCADYRLLGRRLIAPENQRKYRSCGELAIAFFLDAYANSSIPGWNKRLPNPARTLALNLRYAAERTDQYVWCWEEKGSWVPGELLASEKDKNPVHWETLLPGVTDAVRYARDPIVFARQALARIPNPERLKNGDFSRPGKGSRIPGFSFWKDQQGTLEYDPGNGCAKPGSVKFDAASGCMMQKVEVKPGEVYLLEGASKSLGNILQGQLVVYWRDKSGQWAYRNENLTFTFENAGTGKWSKTAAIVEIPPLPEGFSMWVLCNVTTGGTRAFKRTAIPSRDVVWFDDVTLRKVPLPGETK